jgi:hypothetical protein
MKMPTDFVREPPSMFDAVCKDRKVPITGSLPLALAFTQWFDDDDELYWQVAWITNSVDLRAYVDKHYENVAAMLRQLTDRSGPPPSTQTKFIDIPDDMFAPAGKDRKDPITTAQPMTLGFTKQITNEGIVYWQVVWTTDCTDLHASSDASYHNVAAVVRQLTGRGPWHLPRTGAPGLLSRIAGLLGPATGAA